MATTTALSIQTTEENFYDDAYKSLPAYVTIIYVVLFVLTFIFVTLFAAHIMRQNNKEYDQEIGECATPFPPIAL